ncbi:MAG: murein biosynthesis integral membrane protein MurJ [Actinomycetota bacterium]|nr:murein biosynthesis integral membrane protein MurJ [Actinomycetota bacterium]
MAAGTTVSRVTGLLRIIALAYALGLTHLADAYNLANTTPNMIYDVVLGGILAATFIPIFVDRLATRDEHEAWRAISAIITVAIVVLVVMTVIFWVLAPQVIGAYVAFDHASGTAARALAQEKAVATTLLRWFVPQVALYGVISLMAALLNTRRRFAAPMWVPIVNNAVVIGVCLWFHALVPRFPSLTSVHGHGGDLVLLGLGTTAGVLLQAIALLPALRGIGLERLRWHWEPRHEAVRTVVRLGSWTFGFVIANQVALYVVLALAVGAKGTGPLSSYTYAYTFLQMPYAVVAVSIMSAVTPDLAERWATGDDEGFRRRLTGGLRATLAVILPSAMGMLILAHPAVTLLLGHGSTTAAATGTTGAALAMFSLGLPGFCTYLYVVRVLQAMQRTKVAFYLYVVENGLNIVLALVLVGPLGIRGLALSLSIAYTVAALCGIVVLRRWLGALGGPRAWAPLRRAAGATIVMGAVVLVVSNVSGTQHGLGLLLRVAAAIAAGGAVYAGIGALLGGRRQPFALLTGQPTGPGAPAGTARRTGTVFDRDDVGAGAGIGAAWGDPRTPVNTGPRIRIVPAPGAPIARSTSVSAANRNLTAAARRPPAARDTRHVATPRPGAGAGADADGNDDDPGERRWVGGTRTTLRRRRPR